MVADDVGEIGLLDGSLEGDEVEEAFVAFGVFGALLYGQEGVEFLADEDCVFHLALGAAGVHVSALDVDFCAGGVEVLELQFANLAAVHGVGIIGPEALYVEFNHAAANFFVGGEADFDRPVLELRVLHDVLDGGHDFCDAGFVVGPEKGGAVRGDEGFSHVMKHFGEFFRP